MVIRIGNKTKKIKVSTTSKGIKIEGDVTFKVTHEDNCFVAYCPELELSSYGESIENAITHLGEVLDIFFEEVLEKGTLDKVLEECGWKLVRRPKPHWVPPVFIMEKKVPIQLSA